MGDQILSDLDTILKKLDGHNTTNKVMNLSEYNNELNVLKVNLSINEKSNLALQSLIPLIDKNIHSIQKDVITILKGDIDKRLKNSIIDSITKYLMNLIKSKNFTDLICLYKVWKSYDIEKFKEMLANLADLNNPLNCACINSVDFLLEYMLPEITNYKDNKLRQSLVELTTLYIDTFPISDLKPDEFKSLLKKLASFFKAIEGLQEKRMDIWRDTFHILLKYIDYKLSNTEVQEVFKNASIDWNMVRKELGSNLISECLKYITDGDVAGLTKVYSDWKNLDHQKFVDTVQELCNSTESKIMCVSFIFDKLIPIMMSVSNTNDSLKIPYIELGLVFARVFPITSLDDVEYQRLLINLNEYIKNISDLRDKHFEYWEKLWMFLVRLLGKKLHHSMTLINRLLRVVEHAFRNSSYEQRLKGYDCWKELIDNVSLDAHHLSSEKQIRLLLTPLRAKFSRQELVICKRFDVFIYLIEKLQAKGFLVLKEFLEFCFGEVSEDTDPNKAGQGKSFPGLWLRSAKVLIGLLGHSHEDNEDCLDSASEINLKTPVLNSSNISNYCTTVINSVIECCILLKDVELNQEREIILKCLCKTLTQLILSPDVANKEKCMEVLGKSFSKLLMDEDSYKNGIAVMLFKCLISVAPEDITLLASYNLGHLLKIIFTIPLGSESYLHIQIEKFRTLLLNAEKNEKIKYDSAILDSFSKFKTADVNIQFVVPFWLQLAADLDQFPQKKLVDYLLWPAMYLHQISDENQKALVNNYKEVVSKFVEKSIELHNGLFKGLDKCLKNNPLLLKNILTIVALFPLRSTNKETINVTLDLILHILITPFVGDNNFKLEKVESYLKEYYEMNVEKFQLLEPGSVKKLCSCVEQLLKSKRYGILDVAAKSISNLPDNIKAVHAKSFSLDLLTELFEKEFELDVGQGLKFIDLLRNVKQTDIKKDIKMYMPVGGRSARIADLVKQIPASPVKECKSTLRLFGKDIETMSPLNVKGSQMKEPVSKISNKPISPSVTVQKPKKSFTIDDESSSKFVLIHSEVKIKPDKLTEHQKESLKKRREDIPALYQDLSQSISQSLDIHTTVGKGDADLVKVKDDIHTDIQQKSLPENDTKDSSDSNDSKTDKFSKKMKELKKLEINIVDAKKFASTPLRRSRREKKLDEDPENQLNTDESGINHQKVVTIPIEKLNDSINQSAVLNSPSTDKITNSPKRKRRKTLPKRKSLSNNDNIGETESLKDDKVATSRTENDKTPESASNEELNILEQNQTVESDTDVNKEESSIKVVLQISPNGDVKRRPGRPPKGFDVKVKPVEIHPLRKSLRKSVPSKKLIDLDTFNSENERTKEHIAEHETSDLKVTDNQSTIEKPKRRRSRSSLKSTTNEDKNTIKKSKKRKRSDDSESEDYIESSQDASSYSANTTVLRKSLNIKINVNSMTSGYVQSKDDSLTEKKSKRKQEKSGTTTTEPKQNLSQSEELFDESSEQNKSIESHKKRKSKSPKNISIKSVGKTESKKRNSSSADSQILSKHICEVIEDVVNTSIKSLENASITAPDSPKEISERIQDTQTQDTQTQDETQTQNTESVNCDNGDIHLNVDVPKKPVLTDADRAIAMMETASLALESSGEYQQDDFKSNNGITDKSPVHDEDKTLINSNIEKPINNNDINLESTANADTESIVDNVETTISSTNEISVETPDRTAELDELDIPSSPVTGDTPNRNSEFLNNTLDISPIALKQTERHLKDALSDDDALIEEVQPKLMPVALKFDNEDGECGDKEKSPEKADDAPEKSSDDLLICNKVEIEKHCCDKDHMITINNPLIGRSKFLNRPISRRRILKTMSPSVSRIKKLMSNVKTSSCDDDVITNVSQEDILTFSREVPSPLAVPRGSILKRKYPETPEDSSSPCPKRKRVNFSDPCTTSKKIFIKDDNNDKTLFAMSSEEDIDNQFMKILTGNSDAESFNTDSEIAETEESTQIDNDRPIYPNLVDCDTDITVVARKLTGPMFMKALLTKLKNKGIKTIGDLAKTSESDISKFPFKAPVVSNVFKVLDKYYTKNYKLIKDNLEESLDIGENEKDTNENIQTSDAKTSLTTAIGKVKAEGMSTPAVCDILFPLLNQDDLITYARSHFDMVAKEDREMKESDIDPCQGSSKEVLETEPSPSEKSAMETLTEQLVSATQDEIVQMYRLIVDKLAVVSPNKLIDMAIKTLQKIPSTE